MSSELIEYVVIAMTALLAALYLVGARRALDLGNCVGWYLLAFFLSYVLEPFGSLLGGVRFLYQWLRIGSFEDRWHLMGIAVPMAILSFALAYRLAGSSQRARRDGEPIVPGPWVEGTKAYHFAIALIVIGYLGALITMATGTGDVAESAFAGSTARTYQHGTAWLAQSDLFVSTGAVLYYILTGRIGVSLTLATPWLMGVVIKGWGRIHIVVYFFALMAVHFIKAARSDTSGKRSHHRLVFVGAILVLAILFPLLSAIRQLKEQLNIARGAFSPELWATVWKNTNLLSLAATWFSTNTSITGFETSLYYLVADNKAALGLHYFYFYFIVPIPRVLWPGKGAPFTWPQQLLGIEPDPRLLMAGLVPGSIGWAFQEWRWIGIPAEFALTGWVLRKAEEVVRRRPEAAYVQLAYAGLYAMVPQLGRTSLIAMIPQHWLFPFGIPVLFLWLMYLPQKGRAPRPVAVRRTITPVAAEPAL